jgi:transcriptional regulator with XRE-family HTH domain
MERPAIGELLRSLRGGRTLRQVEADTGVSNAYLCNLEGGLKRPGIRTLAKLSDYYQVPLQDLLQTAGLDTTVKVAASQGSTLDVQRSYDFVIADPDFGQLPKPQGSPSIDSQRFIVAMYQFYTGKKLL